MRRRSGDIDLQWQWFISGRQRNQQFWQGAGETCCETWGAAVVLSSPLSNLSRWHWEASECDNYHHRKISTNVSCRVSLIAHFLDLPNNVCLSQWVRTNIRYFTQFAFIACPFGTKKIIWKLQLIGRHTLTFLSRLLSNIWPQNLIFLRVSLRSPTSYLVQQSHKEITNDIFVRFKSDSVWWIATTNGGLWGSLVIMEPFFCAVASSGCQKISPITDLLCISLLFLLFAFLCIAACLLQISFVCGDRQMVCNE